MNIVAKNIPTLPVEVCDIIYEYHKLPFLDEIQNPFNKYVLKHPDWEAMGFWHRERSMFNTKLTYKLKTDLYRVTIIGDDIYIPNNKCIMYNNCRSLSRDILKARCRMNGIEFKERTPTKTLYKKLMKL